MYQKWATNPQSHKQVFGAIFGTTPLDEKPRMKEGGVERARQHSVGTAVPAGPSLPQESL
eukprot:8646028-Pyramimonas_sp.AAC.1